MRPFPQHTSYGEQVIKPSNRTQEELDLEVAEYYDRWKARYLHIAPGVEPVQKYIHWNVAGNEWVSPQNAVTVSEAHGYGMVILAAMAGHDPEAQQDFDAMYYYYKAHPSKFDPHLMSWQQLEITDEEGNVKIVDVEDNDSALDGDMDIAYALLMADNQWGSAGEINYRQEALACIKAIMAKEVDQDNWVLQMGDWVQANRQKEDYNPLFFYGTRSSDFMLNHLRVFAAADQENSAKWLKVLNKTAEIINFNFDKYSPQIGLLADFLVKDETGSYHPAEGSYLEGSNDGDYNWNACRDPWRLPVDYIMTGQDTINRQLTALNQWIKESTAGIPLDIKSGYFVLNGPEGEPIPGRDWGADMSFVAPFAVSAMISQDNQEWLNTLWDCISADEWDKGIPLAETSYFPNTIRMQVMLIVSGNWWMPQ